MRFGSERPWWHHVPLEELHAFPLAPDRRDARGRTVLLPDRFRGRWTRWLQRRLPPERRHEEWVLDARGATVWQAVRDNPGITVRELVDHDRSAHAHDADQAETRVVQFLAGLVQAGCVEFRPTP